MTTMQRLNPGDRVRIRLHGRSIPATLIGRAQVGDGGWHVEYTTATGQSTRYAYDDDIVPFDSIDLGPLVSAVVKRAQLFEAHVEHCERHDSLRAARRFAADVVVILWPEFTTWGEFTEAVAARTSERWVYEWLCALDDVAIFDDEDNPFWRTSRTTARRAAALSQIGGAL